MVTETYLIGVDGGATKTVALIGTSNGSVLGRGESGSSNYHNTGGRAAARSIKKAVSYAMKRARLVGVKPEIAIVALAAINSEKDWRVLNRLVQGTRIARNSFVVHDTIAALYASTKGKPGIIVISGTGSVAAGINRRGEYARAGGWGYLVDDEGSAYDVGRKALKRAFRAIDGRDPSTKLVPIFKRKFKVTRLQDSQNRIYSNRKTSVDEIARLAPLVSNAAIHDQASREILEDAGIKLAEITCAVAKRLKMTKERVEIALVGGNFRSGPPLLRPFKARIKLECPRAQIFRLKMEPARGALYLAVSELEDRRENWTNAIE